MSVTIIIGGQFGSEGKGKVSAYLAAEFDLAIRTGGPNAGHSFEHAGTSHKLQSLPCTVINDRCVLCIGAGAVIDLEILQREVARYAVPPARLAVDPQAVVITSDQVAEEASLKSAIGSTGKGVGAALVAKIRRLPGVTLARDVDALRPYLRDVARLVNDAIDDGKRVLLEGTQGCGLSLHHGFYPYVTSRDTTAAAFCSEAGISPRLVQQIILVIRTYPIRVAGNSGPLPEEIHWPVIKAESGASHDIIEYTTVTNNVRRVGRFDFAAVERAVRLNRPTQLAVNFLDYLDARNRGVSTRAALSENALAFLEPLESRLRVPVTLMGTGPLSSHMIDVRSAAETA